MEFSNSTASVVEDFNVTNVRIELVRPNSTLYPKSQNPSLQWMNTMLSPRVIQIANATTILEILLDERPIYKVTP